MLTGRKDWTVIQLSPTKPIIKQQTQQRRRRRQITYHLHHNIRSVFTNKYSPYQCTDSKRRKRRFEPREIYQTAGLLDFGTTVQTNLKILFMGDSVGIQFSQAFEEAAGCMDRQVLRETASWQQDDRMVHLEGLHSAPTVDGGWVAGWRMTGMLLPEGENKPLPNEAGGGWTRDDVVALAQHLHQKDSLETSNSKPTFDTMIYRIPQGWIESKDVNNEKLRKTTELANEIFGVRSVIFITLPLCNNYMESSHITEMQKANQRILEFAQKYKPTSNQKGVQNVLVLDFGRLAWLLVSWNARLLGFQGSMEHIYTQRLGAFFQHEFFPSAEAHVCSERMDPSALGGDCMRNHISYDGMHWCLETIGGRVIAGLACLVACAHNDEEDSRRNSRSAVQECARSCNDRFMSLEPVHDEDFAGPLS